MSALLRASLKRKKHPVEYADEPSTSSSGTPYPTSTSSPESLATSLPAPSVTRGFELMENFLNNSLSANTKTEYQVCKILQLISNEFVT